MSALKWKWRDRLDHQSVILDFWNLIFIFKIHLGFTLTSFRIPDLNLVRTKVNGTCVGCMFAILLKRTSSPKFFKSFLIVYMKYLDIIAVRFLIQFFIWRFFTQTQINTKNIIDATHRESWKPNSKMVSKFSCS